MIVASQTHEADLDVTEWLIRFIDRHEVAINYAEHTAKPVIDIARRDIADPTARGRSAGNPLSTLGGEHAHG